MSGLSSPTYRLFDIMEVANTTEAALAWMVYVATLTIATAGGALVCIFVCLVLLQAVCRTDELLNSAPNDQPRMSVDSIHTSRALASLVSGVVYVGCLVAIAAEAEALRFEQIVTVSAAILGGEIGVAIVAIAGILLVNLAMYFQIL